MCVCVCVCAIARARFGVWLVGWVMRYGKRSQKRYFGSTEGYASKD